MVEALRTTRRLDELGYAFEEAFNRGPSWHEAIEKGLRLLPDKPRELTKTTITEALVSTGIDLEGFTDNV
jgi:hypothetical protein